MVDSDRTKGCCYWPELNQPVTMTNLLNLTHTTRRNRLSTSRDGLCGEREVGDGVSQRQWQGLPGGCRSAHASPMGVARRDRPDRHEIRLRDRPMRRLYG